MALKAPSVRVPEPSVYHAIMSWSGIKTAQDLPTIFRYPCTGAKKIVISEHLSTFIYFCHVFQSWEIHETVTGVRIAGGTMITAKKNAIKFLKDSNEAMFFKQIEAFGSVMRHPEISYDTAMSYLKAGEQENKRAAGLRRVLINKRDEGR